MAFSLQRGHLGFDPVCQCRNIVQVKICAGDIPHHRQRLEGDWCIRNGAAHHLDLRPAAGFEPLQQHKVVAVTLEQGKQVLLSQVELFGQQIGM